MYTRIISYLTALLAVPSAVSKLLHSLPEDTYAFPKYRVTFLNGLPLLNETAERWLKDGLQGGELEFLGLPWTAPQQASPREIDSGISQEFFATTSSMPSVPPNYTLDVMKMGSRDTYLCLTPKPLEAPPDTADIEPTPVHSWSLLQPLSGTCLYYRTGWFTYSYCFNEEVRQFKELIQARQPGIVYKPEEDPDWDAYTLGKAPATPEPGAELSIAEETALAANLKLAQGAGSRYLVQRWADGTICDKTGKPREVEVQFHCSMTMTDSILFVKESKTCSYVMVIHTPRLCGEPGFKSRQDAREEAYIRCREVVTSTPDSNTEQASLPEADYPFKLPRRKHKETIISPPETAVSDTSADGKYGDIIRKALKAIAGDNVLNLDEAQVLIERVTDDGEIILEVVDNLGNAAPLANKEEENKLVSALKAAGLDLKGEKKEKKINEPEEKDKKKRKQKL